MDKISVIDVIATQCTYNSVVVDLQIAPIRKRPIKRKVYLRDKADVSSIIDDLQSFSYRYFQSMLWNSFDDKWEAIKSAIKVTTKKHEPINTPQADSTFLGLTAHLNVLEGRSRGCTSSKLREVRGLEGLQAM